MQRMKKYDELVLLTNDEFKAAEYLQQRDLLGSHRQCHKCNTEMQMMSRKIKSKDGENRIVPSWRCPKRGCQTFSSVRDGNRFAKGEPQHQDQQAETHVIPYKIVDRVPEYTFQKMLLVPAEGVARDAAMRAAKKEVNELPSIDTLAGLQLTMRDLVARNDLGADEKLKLLRCTREVYYKLLDDTNPYRKYLLEQSRKSSDAEPHQIPRVQEQPQTSGNTGEIGITAKHEAQHQNKKAETHLIPYSVVDRVPKYAKEKATEIVTKLRAASVRCTEKGEVVDAKGNAIKDSDIAQAISYITVKRKPKTKPAGMSTIEESLRSADTKVQLGSGRQRRRITKLKRIPPFCIYSY